MKLTGLEGKYSDLYFKQIFTLIPEKLKPAERKTFQAYDGVNNMFNLAYEMLSWKVHRAMISAKLEPYLGFLHSVQEGKPSLVCDFEELYRYLMDDSVIQYCQRLRKRDFTVKTESLSRKKLGKREYLDDTERARSLVATDGAWVIVGVPNETVGSTLNAGRAYVFTKAGWTVLYTLKSPNPQESGYFGWSVATISPLVFVGAYGETVNSHSFGGRVYMFSDNTLEDTLISPNSQDGGDFGYSVAADNGWLIISAPYESILEGRITHSGAAYVYDITEMSTEGVHATLTSPGRKYQSYFASAIDINGTNAVVGAFGAIYHGKDYARAANIYTVDGVFIKTLYSPNAQAYGDFGYSVAIDSKIIVGAYGESSYTGHAYIFS